MRSFFIRDFALNVANTAPASHYFPRLAGWVRTRVAAGVIVARVRSDPMPSDTLD